MSVCFFSCNRIPSGGIIPTEGPLYSIRHLKGSMHPVAPGLCPRPLWPTAEGQRYDDEMHGSGVRYYGNNVPTGADA